MATTILSSISRPPQAWGNPEGQVPPSLAGIERFLLAADEIEVIRPRVAYLCESRVPVLVLKQFQEGFVNGR